MIRIHELGIRFLTNQYIPKLERLDLQTPDSCFIEGGSIEVSYYHYLGSNPPNWAVFKIPLPFCYTGWFPVLGWKSPIYWEV